MEAPLPQKFYGFVWFASNSRNDGGNDGFAFLCEILRNCRIAGGFESLKEGDSTFCKSKK